MTNRKALLTAAGAGAGILAGLALRRKPGPVLRGQVALITGGSRGVGLELARQFAREGCRVAICARDDRELQRAAADIEKLAGEVMTVQCDITDRAQVGDMIRSTIDRFGRIDILVNNAGIIQVGPIESMTLEDFEQAMNTMFWGVVYPTLDVLPHMTGRGYGRIVNITSIGGKVSVPHLIPYTCAKFAAVGFSEGLRAELGSKGVRVVTIAPGLMRTGSYLNAFFKGDQESESTWFSLGAALPGISMSAERAARQIVVATRRGDSEKILSTPATLAARFHGLFPGATADLLGLVNRLILPEPDPRGKTQRRAADLRRPNSAIMRSLTVLGRAAAKRFHQVPGAETAVHRA